MTSSHTVGGEHSVHVKGTDSEPRELGPKHVWDVPDAFVYLEGALLHFFCREAEALEVPGWSSHAETIEG
jgi:hypothetical protein